LENKILNHLLRNSTYSPPAHIYIALFTTPPNDKSIGVEVLETKPPTTEEDNPNLYTGYTRIEAPAFTIGNDSIATLATTVTFPTAIIDWGEVNGIALMDDVTGGNFLFIGALDYPVTISAGETLQINSGTMGFIINLIATNYSFSEPKGRGGFGNWCASGMLNYILNNISFPSPGTNVWFGLGSNLIETDMDWYSIISLNELTASGYARQKISGSSWSDPLELGYTHNNIEIFFGNPIATEWGKIEYFALFNASSNGDIIFWGRVIPIFLIAGDGLAFPQGKIKIQLD
jgi:hypothetical protein